MRVWLGPAPNEGFDTICPVFGFSISNYKEIHRKHSYGTLDIDFPAVETTSFRQSVKDLLARPWFKRRWVLQEVAFARVPIVHCGHHRASWQQFHYGASDYADYHGKRQLEC